MLNNDLSIQLFPYLSQDKTFGFFISGGLDSAVLLYAACALREKNNLPSKFRVFTVPRHDDSAVHSQRIVDWMSKRFNTTFEVNLVGNPDIHHSYQVRSGLFVAMALCDHIYLGDTNNPEELPDGPVRKKSNNDRFLQPFIDCTKKEVVALAIELGLTELMEISHTCTESKTVRCGKCWQCRERVWAFAKNNYPDPGTM